MQFLKENREEITIKSDSEKNMFVEGTDYYDISNLKSNIVKKPSAFLENFLSGTEKPVAADIKEERAKRVQSILAKQKPIAVPEHLTGKQRILELNRQLDARREAIEEIEEKQEKELLEFHRQLDALSKERKEREEKEREEKEIREYGFSISDYNFKEIEKKR